MAKTTANRQYDPAQLSDRQRDGLACVECGAEPDTMRPVGSTVHGQVFACTHHEQTDERRALQAMRTARDLAQARANTDAALAALRNLMASGVEPSVSEPFLTAFLAEIETTRAEADDLRGQVKALQDHILKAFQWGSDSAWSLAVELDMDAAAISRSARSQISEGTFTAAERTQLVAALNDVIDARQGVRVDGWKPAPMPFDDEGRCADPSCLSCRTSQVSA
ncbi:hypothetical protein ACGFI3_31675 [Nonomuraea wenchangensis]|uniref:hypothetical protein n=1 Tax=Nonomuraea wenchangensis TaxID=568860 RepID=UPI0037183991